MSAKEQKKGALVPRLRFPEFRDAGEWEKSTVNDLLTESCQIGSKGNKAKKLTVKLWGKGVFEKEETFQGSVNTQYYRRQSGQFIYSKLDFLNQAFGIIPHHLDGFESTVDLPCFDFRSDVNPIFFLEYVKREAFYKKFGEIADGGRKAKRIQVDVFLSFSVLLPPQTKEQQKIADCLSSLDERITAETSKLDTLKDHKKGLLQQLFPAEGETLPRLRFPEFQDAGEWEEKKLGKLANIAMCKRILSKETNEKSGVPFFKIGTIGGMPDAFISKELFRKYKYTYNYPKIGEILITCSGTVGKIIAYDGQDAYYQDSNIVWLDNRSGTVINQFLYYFLEKFNWKKLNTTTITRIYGDDLRNILLIFPTAISEQQKIADCLSSLDELITAQTQKIDLLKTHKKGLMQQLFPVIDEAKA